MSVDFSRNIAIQPEESIHNKIIGQHTQQYQRKTSAKMDKSFDCSELSHGIMSFLSIHRSTAMIWQE